MRIRLAELADIDSVRDLLGETWDAAYVPLLGRDLASSLHAEWHSAQVLAKQVGAEHTSFLVG